MNFQSALVCFFSFSMLLHAEAQITITGNDLPQGGVTYPLANATILDFGITDIIGENALWDAGDLIVLGPAPITPSDISQASFSAAFVFNSPFNSTYQCDFFLPTEFPDLGIDLGIPLDGFNNFYQTDGNFYAIAGIGLSASGFDLPVTYDDIDEILPLPMEYGDEMTSTGAFDLDLTGILSYGLVQERSVVVDGWGTLILPSGSFDVLRTRTDLTATDDIYIEQLGQPFTIDREQVTYQWWGQGMGFPLLEITEIAGVPLLSTFQDFSEPSNSISQLEQSNPWTAYPNPIRAGETLQIGKFSAGAPSMTWKIFNVQGQCVAEGDTPSFAIPEALSPGSYYLSQGDHSAQLVILAP